MRRVGTYWDVLEYIGTNWKTLNGIKKYEEQISGHIRRCCKVLDGIETHWEVLDYIGTHWTILLYNVLDDIETH